MAKLLDFEFDGPTGATTTEGGVDGTPGTASLNGDAALDGDGAVWFDGAGDYVELAPDPAFGLSQGTFVIDFTQYALSPGDNPSSGSNSAHTLLSIDSMNFDGGGHLTIYIRSDGQVSVRHQDDTSESILTGGSIEVGTPASVAYSWGSDGSRLLVDGAEVAFTDKAYVLAGDVEPITLGASQTRSGDGTADNLRGFFDGEMSRVQLYDQATEPSGQIPCFGVGTVIQTLTGACAVERLQAGDQLLGHDGRRVEVEAVFHTHVSASTMAACADRRPVRIPRGVLGAQEDLFLSRQHCVLVGGPTGPRLVRAGQLQRHGPPRIRTARGKSTMHYVHILAQTHTVVMANGVPCETLRPGPLIAPMLDGSLLKPLPPCFPYADGAWCRRTFASTGPRQLLPA